ncbi:MAG: hypothetical protein WB439_00980 [Acidobacteriaceae bacterium]
MPDISNSPTAAVTTLKPAKGSAWIREQVTLSRAVSLLLLGVSAVFFALHFLHLTADFPNHSPWMDWSKYTDEGWYGDAAIRHYLTGHWYWKGDFNPAVALPVWPAIELLVFKFTGVSLAAARALTLCVFGGTLVALYLLIQRHTRPRSSASGQSLAAPVAVFLLCTSPFLFVFERMAILEPLLIALTALGLLAASHMRPIHLRARGLRGLGAMLLLTFIVPGIILTKTTGICLLPAIFYMVWARAGYRMKPALRLAAPPALGGAALWCAYFFLFVRPHYLADYQYLFSANAYTGIDLEPIAKVILNTITDGAWMGTLLYILFFAVLVLALFWRPRLLSNPLFPALLLWIGGYFAFLAYHNNLQPRYYLVVAVPITVVVAMGIDSFRRVDGKAGRAMTSIICATVVLAIAIPDALRQIAFVRHPTYQFEAAAQGIKRIVLADKTHSHLILSISGSDLTLMTGLPSIDDDFGTDDLDVRVEKYRPGWYASWNDVEDDKADALTPMYQMKRVAAFPAYDDPARNLLILYRLDPVSQAPPAPRHRRRRHIPKPLLTQMGQQPSDNQLQH